MNDRDLIDDLDFTPDDYEGWDDEPVEESEGIEVVDGKVRAAYRDLGEMT